MDNKKEFVPIGVFQCCISKSTVLEGSLSASDSIKVEGIVRGDIKTSGNVFVSQSATVNGNIEGKNVIVSGLIIGNVIAEGVLTLKSIARLTGNTTVSGFVIEDKSIFEGKCMLRHFPKKQSVPKKTNAKAPAVAKQIPENKATPVAAIKPNPQTEPKKTEAPEVAPLVKSKFSLFNRSPKKDVPKKVPTPKEEPKKVTPIVEALPIEEEKKDPSKSVLSQVFADRGISDIEPDITKIP